MEIAMVFDSLRGEDFLKFRKKQLNQQFSLGSVELGLKDYLAVRPSRPFEQVFLTCMTPGKPLGRLVCWAVSRRLIERFGRLLPSQGAYLLRHSFAKAMLDRGAPLGQIGQVLGHRSLNSTLIYTRVATQDLKEVADNYANLL
jgi:site-specific recombinase XerD